MLLLFALGAVVLPPPAGVRSGEEAADACRHRRPIVLIHGHYYTNASLRLLMDRFEKDGWSRDRLATVEVSRNACTGAWAAAIAARVERLRASTGCSKIDIVAHSRGGHAARDYIRRLEGGAKVAHLVTLGTPHHGAAVNRACPGCGCLEMRPGSSFLSALNEGDETPGPTIFTSIYSRHDEVVSAASAWLSGARNVEVRGVKHSDLLRSKRVYGKVRAGLM